MTAYTEDKVVQTSAEAYGEIEDRLSWLTDDHLGSVLNLVLLEMSDRNLNAKFVEDSISDIGKAVLDLR